LGKTYSGEHEVPTYSYECKKCSHTFDLFHGITADPSVKCPECASKCRRLLGIGAGIIFKGSGFYETDYKRNGGNGNGSSVSGNGKKSESTDTSKACKADSSAKDSSSSSKSSD
jgi:putative FmdB family regulatory protein